MTRASVRRLVPGLVLSLLALAPPPARALILQEVLVTHAGTDDAVVDLPSGERLWLDLRQDCFSLRGRTGWTVLLWSPDPFVSTRSLLLLPEWDVSCPIWQVDTLPLVKPAKQIPSEVPVEGLRARRPRPGGTVRPGWRSCASARASGSRPRPRDCGAR